MPMMRSVYALFGRSTLAAAMLCAIAGSADAQSAPLSEKGFPARPMTLIVPFPAGGPSDALARAVSQIMAAPSCQSAWIGGLL